jgi:hypothetical protein
MSRRATQWLRNFVTAAMMTALAAACAPRARGTVPVTAFATGPVRTPMCEGEPGHDGALFWAAGARGTVRRLPVLLELLPEVSASWRLDGRLRLDEALAPWNRTGLPVRLARAEPGDSASILVTVVRRLPLDPADGALAYRAGVTHLRYDASGAIGSARVVVAEETPRGEPYSIRDQVATLMHELGHALGVPHSDHPFALMSARTVAGSLTEHDVALARAVYGRRGCVGAPAVTASRRD